MAGFDKFTIFKWFCAFAGVAAAAVLLAVALFAFAGGFSAPPCMEETDTCLQIQQIANNRSQQIATVIGISLSAIGTFALVVTIVLSAKATNAAVAAADAAVLTVKIARDTAVRELRPYVSFKNYQLSWNTDDNDVSHWRVRIGWQNTGITAALSVRSSTNHIVIDGPNGVLPNQFDFPDRDGKDLAIGALGRDGSFYQGTYAIPVSEIQRVVDGRATLFVWSCVEYEGLESERRYRTEMAGKFAFFGGPATNKDISSNYTYIDNFNGVDDKCFRPPKQREPLSP
ncbi:hypothetical protein [Rhizobium leguminosarum]|uniref:hypothetical protein n=1 Tax=Rhizobium leguminosarum TaxID=384 RepID=UPI003F98CA2E